MRRGGDPIDFTGNPVAVIDLGSINELSAFLVRVQLGTRELFFGGKKKPWGGSAVAKTIDSVSLIDSLFRRHNDRVYGLIYCGRPRTCGCFTLIHETSRRSRRVHLDLMERK